MYISQVKLVGRREGRKPRWSEKQQSKDWISVCPYFRADRPLLERETCYNILAGRKQWSSKLTTFVVSKFIGRVSWARIQLTKLIIRLGLPYPETWIFSPPSTPFFFCCCWYTFPWSFRSGSENGLSLIPVDFSNLRAVYDYKDLSFDLPGI